MTAVFHPLIIIPLALWFLLYAISSYGPNLAHLVAEFLEIIISSLVVLVGWRTGFLSASHFYRFIAIGYLWVVALQLVHFVSFPALFTTPADPEFRTFLRYGQHLLEALVLLTAPYFLEHRCNVGRSFGTIAITTVGIAALAWMLATSPEQILRAELHLSFQIATAILISGAILYLFGHRAQLDRHCRNYLLASMLLFLAAQLLFEHHRLSEDMFKLLSVWLLFAAVTRAALRHPFRITAAAATPYDAYPDPTIVVDRNGTIQQANAAAQQFATSKEAELVGSSCHGLFHDPDVAPDACSVCLCIRSCLDTWSTEQPIRVGGRYFEITLSPLYTSPHAVHIVQINRDITARYNAEQALRDSEAKYRSLLEHAADGVLLFNEFGTIIETSRRLQEIFRCSRAELIGHSVTDLIPPTARIALLRAQHQLLHHGRATYTRTVITPYGELPIEATVAAVPANGRGFFMASVRDVRERNSAERALRASEIRQRAIFEHVGIGICVCTRDGVTIETNHTMEDFLSTSAPGLRGRRFLDLVYPADRLGGDEWASVVHRSSTNPVVMKLRYSAVGDVIRWGETTVTSVINGDGEIMFAIIMVKDITDAQHAEQARRADEEEIRRARRAAEEASATKTRFLATASHDLRQPIQAIHLLLYLLNERDLSPDMREITDRIAGAVNGLSGMLDGLLDISKLDAGVIQPELSIVCLGPLMKQVADEFQPLAANKGVSLHVVPTSVRVRTDPKLLGRVLRNLVSNAVRYTNTGKVLFGCRRSGGMLRVEVRDTGPGIAREEQSRIFREFHQVGNQGRDRREGLGLGLAIVDRLCKLLDHPIGLQSQPGKGSNFYLTMRPESREAERLPTSQLVLPMQHKNTLVLIVEDEEDIREGMRMLLVSFGFRVMIAASAEAALRAVRESTEAPALMIADYRLGEETGIDVISKVSRLLGCTLPAILLTGDVAAEPVNRARALGIRLLHKPITPEQLGKAIDETLLERRRQPRRRHSAS